MSSFFIRLPALCVMLLVLVPGGRAAPLGQTPADRPIAAAPSIPDALKAWIPWVLERGPDGQDRRACPIDGRDAARRCAWPGRLRLDLDATGGHFEQTWELYAEQWLHLPGDAEVWPQDVQAGARPLPVVSRDGHPAVKLPPGVHLLTGRFHWAQRPESLILPPDTGLLTLIQDGQTQPWPRLEAGGRLWLHDAGHTSSEGDRLRLEVYRRLDDALPLQILTRLELDVSGRGREIRLGPVPLPGGIPLSVTSPLPTRLEGDGTLLIQVRPGRWVLEVTSYHPGAVATLARGSRTDAWPEQEVWAFAAHPDLRQVELSGLTPLDPRQTGLPEEWARLPVYRVGPTERLTLVEQRRGDPDPEPDRLSLSRELWLDFDGSGYSVRDRIGGELTRSWRLETGAGLDLGQVQVAGSPVLITRLDAEAKPGVEVRRGRLDLVADGRLEADRERLPASGWALTFDNVQSRLHLPPGWDLLAVTGVDNLPDTWLERWTLLDLFLVLIVALGVARIWGWGWGALALVALALTWHAPGAPRLTWLHVLAAAALLRLLPQAPTQVGLARLRWLVLWYRRLSLLTLLVLGLPFLVSEVRNGLYPQLEQPYWTPLGRLGSGLKLGSPLPAAAPAMDERASMEGASDALNELQTARRDLPKRPAAPTPRPLEPMDPKALVQTGPGIPSWQWKEIELAWSGPVGQTAQARLWLLTPGWNLVRALLGCLLVGVLGLRLAGALKDPRRAGLGLAVLLSLGVGAGLASSPAQAAELPTLELLDELRERLLEPPDCLPNCLELSRLALRAEPEQLTLELTLEAATAIAARVPGGSGGWSPSQVSLDGAPLDRMSRDAEGQLQVPLPPGRHQILLAGPLRGQDEVAIPLVLPPRQVSLDARGWRVEGLDANGRPGTQLHLVRLADPAAGAAQPLTQDALPPLLLVERRLGLGLDWRVETSVRRLSSPEFPTLVPVSLLPGESVQTPGVQVEAGQVKVALSPGQTELRWTSRLEQRGELELTASEDPRLSEDWQLDLGSMWHLEYSGIPPVHRREDTDRWLPSWRPLPGETLRLRIVRPLGVPGPTFTIDRVEYQVEPSQRGSDATLTLAVRSSQGGVRRMRLPDGAELRELTVDGRSLPLPTGQTLVELPLVPGSQEMRVAWREPHALSTGFSPSVPDLGSPAVDLSQTLRLPDDRWVLFAAGPRVGPAVLFWGLLLVLAGAFGGAGSQSSDAPCARTIGCCLGWGSPWPRSGWRSWWPAGCSPWARADGSTMRMRRWRFNLIQIGLVLLTLAALAALLGAVQQGLLGRPEMQILGNGSSGTVLNWYQDRGGPGLPEVWVLSVPMWIYRALMLAWALWLALRLLDWLRWGWEGFSKPQLWRERIRKGDRLGTGEARP